MQLGLGLGFGSSTSASYSALPLGGIVASCVFDLDATVASSYDGSSQTWLNLETTPADGEAQAAHNFYLGATSGATATDPTFTGTAGNSAAYFSHDGGDYFRNVAASAAAQPAFYKNLHKSTGGQAHTIVLAGRFPATAGASKCFSGNAGVSSVNQGMAYLAPHASQIDRIAIGWYDATGGVSFINCPITSDGTDKIIAVTFDPSTGVYKIYVNQSSSPTTATAPAQVSTTDATYIFELMAGGNGVLPAGSGARLYAASMYNAVLLDADIALIASEYASRHGRTYF